MKTFLLVALVLTVVSFSSQTTDVKLNLRSLVQSVDNQERVLQNLKVKTSSVKPVVKTQIKAGKPKAAPKKASVVKAEAKKVDEKKKAAIKSKAIISQRKHLKIQIKLSADKERLHKILMVARRAMRTERKKRDAAKLKKDSEKFVAAKTKVLGLKANISAAKKNLKQVVISMKQEHSKIKHNKHTLEKVTEKKQNSGHRAAHDKNRKEKALAAIKRRSMKIFKLKNRLAKFMVHLKYAKFHPSTSAGAFIKHLNKGIHRITKRLQRKNKELMTVLMRKHRVRPSFKTIYNKQAKKIYALAKADEPKSMTSKDKKVVFALKQQVENLIKKHEGLVGEKQVFRIKVRAARHKVDEKKQKKKDFKKAAKKSTKGDVKQVKATKKEANNRKFKLVMARLDRASAKEHRHNLRDEDREIMTKVKAMQAKILEVSGVSFKRTNIASKVPKWRLHEIKQRKAKKVKRAEKALVKATKEITAARSTGNIK